MHHQPTEINDVEIQSVVGDMTTPNHDLAVLRTHFPQYFDKSGAFQFEKFKANLAEQDINFSAEGYGLDWLGKAYSRLLASDSAVTLLKPDHAHNQQAPHQQSENLLIKGDNLEVLKHLVHAYYEQVKMIYIDPPYNTGSDGFVYQDDRKFSARELSELAGVDLEKAQRILAFTQSKSNSHSAWLTFMYPRLYIARQLLRDDGVIFISIDDNEVAQLRLLMDEIFGEENFVATFPWKKRSAKSDVPYGVSQDYEWIVCYAKQDFRAGLNHQRKYFYTEDYHNDGWRLSDLTTQRTAEERKNSAIDLVDPRTGKVYPFNKKRVWAITKDSFDDYYKKGKIVFPDDYDFLNISIPAFRVFESEDRKKSLQKYGTEDSLKAISTYLPKDIGMSEQGNKDIYSLFDIPVFSYPKPVSLLKHFIDALCEDSIILDFFAGSGTTGDAVMQLNAQDGGNRKYILVQIPEAIDPKKNKTAYDFVKNDLNAEPTIFEITKERLIRSAQKIAKENPDYQGDLGFQVYETMPIWDNYHFEADILTPQTQLFDETTLTDDDLTALLTTWKTYDGIPLTQSLVQIDLAGYSAYHGKARLYLMHKGFSTNNLKNLLEKMDNDPAFNATSIIIFGYHFDSKSLREITENVKAYANKKSTDIDVMVRY